MTAPIVNTKPSSPASSQPLQQQRSVEHGRRWHPVRPPPSKKLILDFATPRTPDLPWIEELYKTQHVFKEALTQSSQTLETYLSSFNENSTRHFARIKSLSFFSQRMDRAIMALTPFPSKKELLKLTQPLDTECHIWLALQNLTKKMESLEIFLDAYASKEKMEELFPSDSPISHNLLKNSLRLLQDQFWLLFQSSLHALRRLQVKVDLYGKLHSKQCLPHFKRIPSLDSKQLDHMLLTVMQNDGYKKEHALVLLNKSKERLKNDLPSFLTHFSRQQIEFAKRNLLNYENHFYYKGSGFLKTVRQVSSKWDQLLLAFSPIDSQCYSLELHHLFSPVVVNLTQQEKKTDSIVDASNAQEEIDIYHQLDELTKGMLFFAL